MLADRIKNLVYEAFLKSGYDSSALTGKDEIVIEKPKYKQGDYATTLPFALAKILKIKPMEIAEKIVSNIQISDIIEKVETAAPGFINIHISSSALRNVIREISESLEKYGHSDLGHGKKIQVEFVSANPTGPLSVGHGRLAAFGDSLASVLSACGFDVEREFYINDVGNQINNLAMSVDVRYREILGENLDLDESGYQGEYIIAYASELKDEYGDSLLKEPEDERRKFMADYTIRKVLEEQADTLEKFGVVFKRWFREKELYDSGLVDITYDLLKEQDIIYEKEGASWFKSTQFTDSQDRVLKKSNGAMTYFLSDIAYHKDKFNRGFDTVIDIWGADHHGYIERMKSSVAALGIDPAKLEVLIVQLVRFKESGDFVRMSKRAGKLIPLSLLVDEVGKDAARFFFLWRTRDSHLEFDIELAKEKSEANPMFYLQYAHARVQSLLRKGEEAGLAPDYGEALSLLSEPQEMGIMKKLEEFPSEVLSSGLSREPHRIILYLTSLASDFHSFYYNHTVISEQEQELSKARLALCEAVGIVLKNGLALLGIDSPDKM